MPPPSNAILAAGLALLLVATTSPAAGAETDTQLTLLQQRLSQLQAQLAALKQELAAQSATVERQSAEVSERHTAPPKPANSDAGVTLSNGSLAVTTPDGSFSVALAALGQIDFGYYMQGVRAKSLPAAYGPDLSSGGNVRRAAIGIRGKLFSDWSYLMLYSFGNAFVETPGAILFTYLQYDALAPWYFRIGVFAPSSSIEDAISPVDLLFVERSSSANLQRNLAGSEGRDAMSVYYAGDRLFGALSLTGGKVQENTSFDEQLALVGRLSYMVYADRDADMHLVAGANLVHIFKLPDLTANDAASWQNMTVGGALHGIGLSDYPEISVDDTATRLVNTGVLSANHVTSWSVETAGNWRSIYLQAGYYRYLVDRAPLTVAAYTASGQSALRTVRPSDNAFGGWSVQGSWVLTGESRSYVKASGAFTIPKPKHPFAPDSGWGAWEVAARYSELDLNDHVRDTASVITGWSGDDKTYNWYNTVRGGDQKIVTLGLNWYPNPAIRFMLDYLWIRERRLQSPAAVVAAQMPELPVLDGGQTVKAVVLRTQVVL
jgi:phosphate-selective porin OprO and OprP